MEDRYGFADRGYVVLLDDHVVPVMDFIQLPVEDHTPYVTITQGMRGYFAVMITWDAECQGFGPWQSGAGSYGTMEEAVPEAKGWAEVEGIEFRMPKQDPGARCPKCSKLYRFAPGKKGDGRVSYGKTIDACRACERK